MKAAITLAFIFGAAFFAVTGPAQSMLVAGDPLVPITAATLEDATINSGPSRAMLESRYFNAPQSPSAGATFFTCRLPANLFQKTLMVRACD